LTLPGRITENKKPRNLALEGPYREIVKRRLAARRLDCPLIFHRDGQPMKSFRKAWKRACSQAGVPALLFHDLGRTSIRNMIRAGIDRKIARMISGHRTESIFTRYDITDDDDLRDAVLKIEQYVSGLPAVSTVVPLESAKVAQP
jgi:integrase